MAQHIKDSPRAICDYEGTSYRARFWEGQGREYEDLAERWALRRLLPPRGARLLEIGAGFGRLSDLYDGYDQVVLLDYAKSGLREARQRLGSSERYVYVAADLYHLPLAPDTCDTVVTVRVLHHLMDVPVAFRQIATVLRPGGSYVLEYANKRNLKAILRYGLRRQSWSPFERQPYEFARLNYDFHPAWIADELRQANFHIGAGRAVSHFRAPLFKRLAPPRILARLDGGLQRIGAALKLAPSVFLRTTRPGTGTLAQGGLFRCPTCGSTALRPAAAALICGGCGAQWAVEDGIYDFKAPINDQHANA